MRKWSGEALFSVKPIGKRRKLAADVGLQARQQIFAVVPVDAAADADALQVQRDNQVVQGAARRRPAMVGAVVGAVVVIWSDIRVLLLH